jgi:hypothetical protein
MRATTSTNTNTVHAARRALPSISSMATRIAGYGSG